MVLKLKYPLVKPEKLDQKNLFLKYMDCEMGLLPDEKKPPKKRVTF